MSQTCVNPGCNKETNNKDGICSGCRIERSYQSPAEELSRNIVTANGIIEEEEFEDMGQKKKCISEGCERPVQRKGLCYRCYKEKHGRSPYPGMDKKGGSVKKLSDGVEKGNGGSSEPDKVVAAMRENGKYSDRLHISIDLSGYPNLCKVTLYLAALDPSLPDVVFEQMVALALAKAEKEMEI